jgi:hypothetical protein
MVFLRNISVGTLHKGDTEDNNNNNNNKIKTATKITEELSLPNDKRSKQNITKRRYETQRQIANADYTNSLMRE